MNRMVKIILLALLIAIYTGCATYQEVDTYYSEPHIGQYEGIEPADVEAMSVLLIIYLFIFVF